MAVMSAQWISCFCLTVPQVQRWNQVRICSVIQFRWFTACKMVRTNPNVGVAFRFEIFLTNCRQSIPQSPLIFTISTCPPRWPPLRKPRPLQGVYTCFPSPEMPLDHAGERLLLTLGTHVRGGLQQLSCMSVCVSVFSILPSHSFSIQ